MSDVTTYKFDGLSRDDSKLSLVNPFNGEKPEVIPKLSIPLLGSINPWYNHETSRQYSDVCHANWWKYFNKGAFSTFFYRYQSQPHNLNFWWPHVLKQIPIKYPWLMDHLYLYIEGDKAVGFYIDVKDWSFCTKHALMNFLIFQRYHTDHDISATQRAVDGGMCFRKAMFMVNSGWSPEYSHSNVSKGIGHVGAGSPIGHSWLVYESWRWLSDKPGDPFLLKGVDPENGYLGIDRDMWFVATGARELSFKLRQVLWGKEDHKQKYMFVSLRHNAPNNNGMRVEIGVLSRAIDQVKESAEKLYV